MKIKKVDDKPMVVHTKEKAKIHAHEPKGAKIKGSNIYTLERGPKTIGAKGADDKKKSYRKSTIHQSELKNKGLSRFKRNYRESNTSIKTKNTKKAAATAAGTAVAPGVGTAIGMAAGYAAGVSIEVKDEKMTNRSRKIKFFLDKMKAQENQTDSVAKLVKDLIVRKAITWVKAAAPIIGLVLLLLVLVVAMIAVPVIAVIAIIYNSPFALFLPSLESGDTVQTVTSAYVQEFNRDVNWSYVNTLDTKS